jgi:hypothetical protein
MGELHVLYFTLGALVFLLAMMLLAYAIQFGYVAAKRMIVGQRRR